MREIKDLFLFQKDAIRFLLSRPKSGLLIDLSLGKTVIALTTIKRLIETGNAKRFLVVAPINVMYNTWPDEITSWRYTSDLSFTILHGSKKNQLLHETNTDIYLVNYSSLLWLTKILRKDINHYRSGKKQFPFDGVFFDESTKMKAHSAKRFKMFKILCPMFKRSHIMTATIAPMSLLNIWSQWYLVDAGKALGTAFTGFRNEHFYEPRKYKFVPKPGTQDYIYNKIKDNALVLRADKLIDVPEVVYNKVVVSLSKSEQKQYDELEKEFFLEVDGKEVEALSAGSKHNKLRQFIQGALYYKADDLSTKYVMTNSVKTEQVRHLVDMYGGDPVIITLNYLFEADFYRAMFGKDVPVINSNTTGADAREYLKKWNEGKLSILIAHPSSISHGLNLQFGGRRLCWSALTGSPETFHQMVGRLKRMHQKRKILVDLIIMKNTIDEITIASLKSRHSQQEGFKQAIEDYRAKKGC